MAKVPVLYYSSYGHVEKLAHKSPRALGWDPYPSRSFVQAAYAALAIMMSQNRQQDIDRKAPENDYRINVKAELELELLHEKIDQLREREGLRLTEAVRTLTDLLEQSASGAREPDAEGGRHNERLST